MPSVPVQLATEHARHASVRNAAHAVGSRKPGFTLSIIGSEEGPRDTIILNHVPEDRPGFGEAHAILIKAFNSVERHDPIFAALQPVQNDDHG